MQFSFHDGFYKAARITGPSHNILGLNFSTKFDSSIEVVQLPVKPNEAFRVDKADVIRQIIEAQNEFNEIHGTSYVVSRVAFLPSDSPSVSTYRQLALAIMERLNSGEPFKSV